MCVFGALAACMQPALAVDIKAGDWTLNVGGNVNAYYTYVDCDGGEVGGLALAGQALGCAGKDNRTTVGNGLLPSALVTSATSTRGGYDVKALIGIYVHAATDSAIAQNSEVDVRQAYFSFGNATLGTFKLGRDNGIFGANAILNDMTLMGAGAPVQATQRGRVALPYRRRLRLFRSIRPDRLHLAAARPRARYRHRDHESSGRHAGSCRFGLLGRLDAPVPGAIDDDGRRDQGLAGREDAAARPGSPGNARPDLARH